MKRTRLVLFLLTLVLAVMFSSGWILATSADETDGTVYSEIGSDGSGSDYVEESDYMAMLKTPPISLSADATEPTALPVYLTIPEKIDVASYQLVIGLPDFVTVTSIGCSYQNSEKCVFEAAVAEDGAVHVTFSSPYNIDGYEVNIFTIYMVANQDNEGVTGTPWLDESILTNTSTETVDCGFWFGDISVGEENLILKGDFDNDGNVTIRDVIAIQIKIVNMETYTDYEFSVADIDNNGVIDIVDCQWIQLYLIGAVEDLNNPYIGGGTTDPEEIMVYVYVQNSATGETYDKSRVGVAVGTTYGEFYNTLGKSVSGNFEIESITNYSGIEAYGSTEIIPGGETFVVLVKDNFTYSEEDVMRDIYLADSNKIYLGSSSEQIIEQLVGRNVTVNSYVYDNHGNYRHLGTETVALTADMITDVSGVDTSKLGSSDMVYVTIGNSTNSFYVQIVPDMTGATVLGEFAKPDGGSGYDFARIYSNGYIEACDFSAKDDEDAYMNYMTYTTEENNGTTLYAVSTGDMPFDLYYVVGKNTYEGYSVIEDYAPGRADTVTTYRLVAGENSVQLDVFQEVYAVMTSVNSDGSSYSVGTIRVSFPEDGKIIFYGTTYDIDENNNLVLGLPDADSVATINVSDEMSLLLYEDGIGYYLMNDVPSAMIAWAYTNEDQTEIEIDLGGQTMKFYYWSVSESWIMEEEPDWDTASRTTLIYVNENNGEETYTYYSFSDGKSYLYNGYDYNPAYMDAKASYLLVYTYSGSDYRYLIIDGTLKLLGEHYEIIYSDGNMNQIDASGDGYAYGYLNYLNSPVLTYVIASDGTWTFYQNGEVVGTATLGESGNQLYWISTSSDTVTADITVVCLVDRKPYTALTLTVDANKSLWDQVGPAIKDQKTESGILDPTAIYLDDAFSTELSSDATAADGIYKLFAVCRLYSTTSEG